MYYSPNSSIWTSFFFRDFIRWFSFLVRANYSLNLGYKLVCSHTSLPDWKRCGWYSFVTQKSIFHFEKNNYFLAHDFFKFKYKLFRITVRPRFYISLFVFFLGHKCPQYGFQLILIEVFIQKLGYNYNRQSKCGTQLQIAPRTDCVKNRCTRGAKSTKSWILNKF